MRHLELNTEDIYDGKIQSLFCRLYSSVHDKERDGRMHEFNGWKIAHAPGLCWNLCSLGSSLRRVCSPFVRKCSGEQHLCVGGKMKGVKEV